MKETKKTFKKIILDDLKANKLNSIVSKIKSIKHEKYSGGNSLRIIAVDLTKSERESF